MLNYIYLCIYFAATAPNMPPKKHDEPERKPLIGRIGTNLRIGIVGVPNVGKSTFFNVLTQSAAPAENFPFCTIKPNENKYSNYQELRCRRPLESQFALPPNNCNQCNFLSVRGIALPQLPCVASMLAAVAGACPNLGNLPDLVAG